MKKGILADSFFAHIIKFFVCHVKVFVHIPQKVHENFGGGRKLWWRAKLWRWAKTLLYVRARAYIKKLRLL